MEGHLGPADIAPLCEQTRALVEASCAELLVCDVGAVVEPDASTVEALARLHLTARRLGCRMGVARAPSHLLELVALMGLAGVLETWTALDLEPVGEAEEGEQMIRVEEEADPRDRPP